MQLRGSEHCFHGAQNAMVWVFLSLNYALKPNDGYIVAVFLEKKYLLLFPLLCHFLQSVLVPEFRNF